MSREFFEEQLIHLMEECGEVIQASSKCIRFGINSMPPKGYGPEKNYVPNQIHLLNELNDLEIKVDLVKDLIYAYRS
jgi:hypothetical protein